MSDPEDWAMALRVADVMARGPQRAAPQDEPTLMIQQIAGNPVLCGGPVEHFSQDMPIWAPKTPEEEVLRPIDVLYGHYDPITRSIDIFINRIRQDAGTFDAEVDELLEIVRLHEHAHAVAHLGTRADDAYNHLSSFAGTGRTAWSPFVDERTRWFAGFPTELHEFLAQGLTYAALSPRSEPHRWALPRSEKLRGVFDALEAKQPLDYKLCALVKQRSATANWPLVLDAARGAIDICRELGFTLKAGLNALVCSV